jgi:hypothetical protein
VKASRQQPVTLTGNLLPGRGYGLRSVRLVVFAIFTARLAFAQVNDNAA